MSLKKVREFFALERNVLLASVIGIGWAATVSLWDPFVPKFYENLGASILIIGFIISLTTAVESFSSTFGGYLSDRYGRKKIIVLSGYVIVLSSLLYSLSMNWLQVIIPAALMAFAVKGFRVSREALIGDTLKSKKRATGFSTYYTLTLIPAIFTTLIGGWLMQTYGINSGMRIAFIATVLVCLLIFTPAFFYIKETLKRRTSKKAIKFRDLLKFLRNIPKQLVALIISNSIISFGGAIPSAYVVFYLLDMIHITPFEFSILLSIQTALSVLALIPMGKLSDKIGRKPFIILLPLMWILSLILMVFAQNFSHLMFAFILGALSASAFPSISAYIADLTSKRQRAKIIGVEDSLSGIAAVPGPLIGGILYFIDPKLVFIVSALIGLLSLLIILKFVKEIKKRK